VATQAEVDLVINASNALPQVTRDLNRIVTTAENGAPDIDLDAALNTRQSLASVRADLARVIATADASADDIDLTAVLNQANTLRDLDAQLSSVISRAQAGAAQDPIQIQGVLDGARTLVQVRGELDRVITTAQRTAPPVVVRGEIDWDRDQLRGVGNSLADVDFRLGRIVSTGGRAIGAFAGLGARIVATGAAASSAAPLLAGVVGAVQNLIPAAAVATTGILALQLATNTVRLGMIGVEDAITNAFDPDVDPEELAKSLERLAPEARKFVLELSGMRKEFRELQLGVQDRLFKDLDGTLKDLSRSALPQVRGALNDTADTLNRMARGVGDAAAELAENGTLGRALDGATEGLNNLVEIPGQATTAFGQLAAAAAPAFDRITEAIAKVADEASEGLTRAFESGELEKSIDDAVSAIAQLGRIAGNVFGTLGNIINAASVEGDGLFGTLEKVTQALQDVTGSEEFQVVLEELLKTMSTAATEAFPIFTTALGTVSQIIQTLAPVVRDLLEVLGPILVNILEEAEAPLLTLAEAIGLGVEALTPFIELAGELISAILPALTPLFESLKVVIEELTPFFQALADNLGAQLVPLLERLPEILGIILPAFEKIAQDVLPELTEILVELAPHLEDLAEQLGDLLVELAPVIAEFIEFGAVVVSKLLPYIGPLLTGLLEVLISSLNGLAQLLNDFVVPALRSVSKFLSGDFAGALKTAGVDVDSLQQTGSRAFDLLAGNALRSMSKLASDVGNWAQQAGVRLLAGISRGIDNTKTLLNNLPGIARAAAGNLGTALFGAGAQLIGGLIRGISSKIGEVRSKLSELTNLIPDWKGPMDVDRKLLTPNGEAIMDSLLAGFDSRLPEIRAQLGSLTATIPSSVGVPRVSMAPQIHVTIGGQAVDQYVTYRVREENATNERIAAQGVRR
jgi:phage-related protein